jgi:hypothetical protein
MTPPPSAAALAAQVKKSARHQLAEDTLTQLRARRSEIQEQLVDACNNRTRAPDPATGSAATIALPGAPDARLINKLDAEVTSLDQQIRAARVALAPMRAAHGEAVAKALSDEIATRSATALQALMTLRSDVQWIAEAYQAIERAGLRLNGPWLPPQLGELENFLRKRAGAAMKLSAAAE